MRNHVPSRRFRHLTWVIVAVLLIGMGATASAQESDGEGYLAIVNGASVEAVAVSINEVPFEEEVEPAGYAVAGFLASGEYAVDFGVGDEALAFELLLEPGDAVTVVTSQGEDGPVAVALPIEVAPIDEESAALTVWNATDADTTVSIDESEGSFLEPGEALETIQVAADTELTVTVDGATRTIEPAADSHTDVFIVDNGETTTIAIAVVPSMTELIETLFPLIDDGVEIPEVEGQPAADAQSALEDLGFEVLTTEVSSESIEAGLVVDVDPEPGLTVAAGSTVTIAVSTGPKEPPPPATVEVPNVAGLAAGEAQAELEAAEFAVVTEEGASEEVAEGLVIATTPNAGSEVAPGSTVTMLVSTGPPPPAIVVVPEVAGSTVDAATAALTELELEVAVEEQADEDVEEGIVLSANPSSGIEVTAGTVVTLIVSSGPAPVLVPDLAGLSIEEATTEAEAAGLVVEFVEDPDAPDPDGVVVDQEPKADEEVMPGSSVVAQLSPAIAEPWAILVVTDDRRMSVTGINFLPGSTTDLRILRSALFDAAIVDDDGSWTERYDLTGVVEDEETLLVRGTAADGSPYEQTFLIPAAGEVNEEPIEEEGEGGFPWWGWLLLVLAVVALGVIGVIAVKRLYSSDDEAAAGPTEGASRGPEVAGGSPEVALGAAAVAAGALGEDEAPDAEVGDAGGTGDTEVSGPGNEQATAPASASDEEPPPRDETQVLEPIETAAPASASDEEPPPRDETMVLDPIETTDEDADAGEDTEGNV